MSLNAGALDREIVIQTATKTQNDDTGEEIKTWGDDQTVWAQWVPKSADEVYRDGNRLAAIIDGVFRIYYMETLPTPDASQVIDENGRVYDIVGVTEIGRKEGLELAVRASDER